MVTAWTMFNPYYWSRERMGKMKYTSQFSIEIKILSISYKHDNPPSIIPMYLPHILCIACSLCLTTTVIHWLKNLLSGFRRRAPLLVWSRRARFKSRTPQRQARFSKVISSESLLNQLIYSFNENELHFLKY